MIGVVWLARPTVAILDAMRLRSHSVTFILPVVVTVALLLTTAAGVVSPASAVSAASAETATEPVTLDCADAGVRHELTTSTDLDPSCVWTAGFDITASDVVLDCHGALIANDGGGRGIEISSPTDTAMSGVVVRNCRVEGFLNNLRVTRPGFRELEEGVEYENGLTGVIIEHNEFRDSRGVGVFIDGYVSDAVIRDNVIEGTGSAGIYLETGSRRTRVENNVIHDNGFIENGPGGQVDEFGGLRFRWWGIGREGLAIDGSYENVVVGNHFEGNSHGGILLYTNCGEFPDSGRWFDRRWPSDRNRIEDNTFVGGLNGVWVGQRMAENTLPMECTKPAYVEGPLLRITRDFAADNEIVGNHFTDVRYPIRVEDHGTLVEGNDISSSDPDHHGIIVGTEYLTDVLDEPITGTVVRDDTIAIVGNESPIRWIHGYGDLTVDGNTSNGVPVGICEGVQPPRLGLIWVISAALEPAGAPETPAPADLSHPVLDALPPCPRPAPPTVVAGFATATEGSDAVLQIPVTLSHASDQTVEVSWQTLDIERPGFAGGSDIEPASGTISFDPGQTEAVAEIVLIDDTEAEWWEFAVIGVREPRNAKIGGFLGLGLGLISDDDLRRFSW